MRGRFVSEIDETAEVPRTRYWFGVVSMCVLLVAFGLELASAGDISWAWFTVPFVGVLVLAQLGEDAGLGFRYLTPVGFKIFLLVAVLFGVGLVVSVPQIERLSFLCGWLLGGVVTLAYWQVTDLFSS